MDAVASVEKTPLAGGEQRGERQRGELGEGREGEQGAAFDRRAEDDQRPDEQRRDQRVVGVGLKRVVGERVGGPGEAEDDAEACPAEPAPKDEQPGDGRQVEDDRGGMGGGEVVPGAVPRQRELERDVGVVVEGAVGVAEGIVGGERVQAPDGLPVGDVVGADHAGVADVDDAGVGDVEGDSKAEQERAGDAPARRSAPTAEAPPRRRGTPPRASARADRRAAGRRAGTLTPMLAALKKIAEMPNEQQDEQVEVDDPPLAAPVEEAEQEDRRERQPDVGSVELVAELVGVAAGHLPGDLVAGPRLAHRPGGIVDDHLHPLRPAGVEVHLPGAGLGLRRGAEPPVAPALLGDLGVGAGDPDRPGLGQFGVGWPARGCVAVAVDDPAFDAGVEPGAGVPCPSAATGSARAISDGGDERRALATLA